MANSEALSHGRAGTRGGVGLPLHAVEHRLANAYRSMQVVGGPPTGLARIRGSPHVRRPARFSAGTKRSPTL